VDERQAAALCYTSGTTGNPKGVLYSHRSISLHSTATLMKDGTGLSRADRVLAVVPMFHANAWGLPYGAALAGADLILPDRFLAGRAAGEADRGGAPDADGLRPDDLRRPAALCRSASRGRPLLALERGLRGLGGAAAADEGLRGATWRAHLPGMGDDRDESGRHLLETEDEAEHDDAYWESGPSRAGRCRGWSCAWWTTTAKEVAWDGESTGEIEVRGPWIAARYFRDESGDEKFDRLAAHRRHRVGRRARGFVQITDRAKDVIKSGGEWISSVELENEVMAHPDVVEAAVIAKPDERWAERPLCCVVLREGARHDRG
jgi:fatty-acyl-CoA synthase